MATHALRCLLLWGLLAAAKAQEPELEDLYIDRQFLSYIGYFLLGVVLLVAFGVLAVLCWHVPGRCVSFAENMMLQVPEAGRLFLSDLRDVESSSVEVAACSGYGDLARTSCAYLGWRRTQLDAATFLNVAVLVLNVFVLRNDNAFDTNVEASAITSDAYSLREHAQEQLLQFIPLAQSIIALTFTASAAWNWAAYKHSIYMNILGWLFVFFIPFLYFFVPWMDIVSPKEHVQGLCTYLLDAIDSIFNDADGVTTLVRADGLAFKVSDVCSRGIKGMADTVANNIVILDKVTGQKVASQLVLTFVGMVLQYIIYLPFLVGALTALKSLGPGVLGMMLGLQGGLKMSKLMFPGLRVTSWMLIILQASALPVVMCLMALLLVVVGTVPVMFTAVFVTAAMSLYIMFWKQLLRAARREEAIEIMTLLGRVSMVLMLLGLLCLVLGVYLAEHLVALSDMGISAVKSFMKPLFISKLVVRTLAGMFTSKVVFTDIVLHIIISTYLGVYEDEAAARKEIFEELTAFGLLFPEYTAYSTFRELEMVTVQDCTVAMGETPPTDPPAPSQTVPETED